MVNQQKNIGINLWSIKEHLTTIEEADESLRRLAEAGCSAVELCLISEMPDAQTMKRLCDRYGLAVCGLHDMTVLENPVASLQAAKTVGSGFVSFPYPQGRDLSDPDQVSTLVEELNEAGRVLYENGVTLTYHNHQVEFARADGALVLDRLVTETDPRTVQFQLDLYWVQLGGGNPVQWCKNLEGRLPQLHVKDYAIGADGQPCSCAVGKGNLSWAELVDHFDGKQLIIEQELYTSDPFDELAEGIRFLSSFGS
ncbi:hypothetical protein PDESU_02522 [Pontiella desulfatans]|uniref:Xylose isomerase-like TIM barrel domain-containing protein n=1 Tax=Pontiella desulfatans TaxID=2750659 RepID=A0A6C2U294_PONDE|nr:sugar phosphate isomerase/epimerase [Pontiella desulfatans]VGO13965.1 hypothetical protein PDESU_02522 [Pontiella desulfatans]